MWSTFDIPVPDPVPVVRDRLAAALADRNRRFRVTLTDDGFEVRRVLRWCERTFEITAWGRFESAGDGTVVRVGTGPREWQFWLIVAWSVVWVVILAVRFGDARRQGGAAVMVAFTLGMIAFAWLLLIICTTVEERTYRRRLAALLAAPAASG